MSLRIRAFFNEHPTMLLTLCYFIITAIGVLYSYFFYEEFGINILKFADLSDFLLASISEPLSLVVFALMVILSIFIFWFDFTLRKKFPSYGRFLERKFMPKYSDPIGFVIMIASFTFSLISILATKNVDEIKQGGGDEFLVRTTEQNDSTADRKLIVLGSSSRYAYFYDPVQSIAVIIPVENVAYLKKSLPITLPINDDEELVNEPVKEPVKVAGKKL